MAHWPMRGSALSGVCGHGWRVLVLVTVGSATLHPPYAGEFSANRVLASVGEYADPPDLAVLVAGSAAKRLARRLSKVGSATLHPPLRWRILRESCAGFGRRVRRPSRPGGVDGGFCCQAFGAVAVNGGFR